MSLFTTVGFTSIPDETVGEHLKGPAACKGLPLLQVAGREADMSLQHYRTTAFGECLVDSLDNLVTSGKISGDLAIKVLAEVSTTACRIFERTVRSLLTPHCLRVERSSTR